jgi:hypothetical protein
MCRLGRFEAQSIRFPGHSSFVVLGTGDSLKGHALRASASGSFGL